jgi:hypothetical protein
MATSYNINTIQGDHLQLTLAVKNQNYTPINLSGYDVRGVVKYAYFASPPALDESGNYISGYILNLNPVINSGVSGNLYASGLINVDVSSYTMASVPVGTFVYDIERFPYGVPTGNSIKLIRGKFIVSPEVTSF